MRSKSNIKLCFIPLVVFMYFACSFYNHSAISDTFDTYQNSEGHFSFKLPSGWEIIPTKKIRELVQLFKRETGAVINIPDNAVMFQRSTSSLFEYPYFSVIVVKQQMNDESIQKDILKVQEECKQIVQNANLNNIMKDISFNNLSYDKKRKLLIYTQDSLIDIRGVKQEVSQFAARYYYKDGIVLFNYTNSKSDINKDASIVMGIIQSFAFDTGYELEEVNHMETILLSLVFALPMSLLCYGITYFVMKFTYKNKIRGKSIAISFLSSWVIIAIPVMLFGEGVYTENIGTGFELVFLCCISGLAIYIVDKLLNKNHISAPSISNMQ